LIIGGVLISGILLAAGLCCLAVAFARSTPRLEAALEQIAGAEGVDRLPTGEVGPVRSRSDRLGAFLYRVVPIPLSNGQRRALRLQDKSIAQFYADKAVMAIIGAVLPALAGGAFGYLTGYFSPIPAVAAAAGGVIGFFIPDLLLRRTTDNVRTGAAEALLVYIDLVTLERLTNASATQALHNAAALSDVPLFVQIRTALERARLEQQSPYAELRRLSEELKLPELADIADVMQLDETGAALSGTLRARVRELRDAHLTREQIKASAAAEGMTIYMTLPALIFGLIFLVAAMLRILAG
jgi:tight adherence protein C